LPTKLDGHGNYAIGLKDHTIFPELPLSEAGRIFGLQIQITTTAGNDEVAKSLLRHMGMPFQPDRVKKEGSVEKTAPMKDTSPPVS
jgi:ribosomal protein L5